MRLPIVLLFLLFPVFSCGPAGVGQSAALPVPSASSGDREALTSNSCGVERWSVKTGTDADVHLINLNPQVSTVGHLADPQVLPYPGDNVLKAHAASRIKPYETTVFQVHATLVAYRLEKDSDEHLVLSGEGRTMIAEIPKPPCVGSTSPFAQQIAVTRKALDAHFPHAEEARLHQANLPVTVTGVGFYDFPHGQTGLAPNAVELHPVLAITWPASPVADI